jgi:hypothetical protein
MEVNSQGCPEVRKIAREVDKKFFENFEKFSEKISKFSKNSGVNDFFSGVTRKFRVEGLSPR